MVTHVQHSQGGGKQPARVCLTDSLYSLLEYELTQTSDPVYLVRHAI